MMEAWRKGVEVNKDQRDMELKDETAIQAPTMRNQSGTMATDGSYDSDNEPATPSPAKPAAVFPAKDYSDLEVCSVIPPTYGDARGDKMAVFDNGSEKTPAFGAGAMLSPSTTDPVPAYPNSVRTDTSLSHPEGPLTKGLVGDYAEWEQQRGPPAKKERQLFGLNSRSLSLMGIGAVAFILILLSTVLGITLTMKINSRSRDSGSGSSVAASNNGSTGDLQNGVLSGSKLAALNWTDGLGNDRSAVFYQDRYDSIMVSLKNSVSNQWTQSNVSQALMNSTGSSKIDILSGSPLAVVTNKYQLSLYYLTTENDVAEVWSPDVVGQVWYAGQLESSLSPLRAMNGSSLAAHWQICNNCTASLCVTFQEESGQIQLANLTNNNWQFSGPITTSKDTSVNGTGLAIRQFTENNATGRFGTDPNAVLLYSFGSKGLLEFEKGPSTNSTWTADIASKFKLDCVTDWRSLLTIFAKVPTSAARWIWTPAPNCRR